MISLRFANAPLRSVATRSGRPGLLMRCTVMRSDA